MFTPASKRQAGAPKQEAGQVLAHHGDLAHGVTRLEKGVRIGLYALVARADAERGC